MSPLHVKFSTLDGMFVLRETGKISRRAFESPVRGLYLLKTCTMWHLGTWFNLRWTCWC